MRRWLDPERSLLKSHNKQNVCYYCLEEKELDALDQIEDIKFDRTNQVNTKEVEESAPSFVHGRVAGERAERDSTAIVRRDTVQGVGTRKVKVVNREDLILVARLAVGPSRSVLPIFTSAIHTTYSIDGFRLNQGGDDNSHNVVSIDIQEACRKGGIGSKEVFVLGGVVGDGDAVIFLEFELWKIITLTETQVGTIIGDGDTVGCSCFEITVTGAEFDGSR